MVLEAQGREEGPRATSPWSPGYVPTRPACSWSQPQQSHRAGVSEGSGQPGSSLHTSHLRIFPAATPKCQLWVLLWLIINPPPLLQTGQQRPREAKPLSPGH